MAAFSQDELNAKFHQLLVTYNERVEAIEVDKSVMIEIPPNLAAIAAGKRVRRTTGDG
jgi:hypothetical protein